MGDGRLDIDTRINTKNLDKDLKSVDTKLKGLSKSGGSSLGNLANSFTSIIAPAGAVAGTIAVIGKSVKALSDAYRKQAQAETQLETAAKNNPYLNEANVATLKSFASELQSISTVGDEELLPMMAQLAANGRTQKEIMDITRAAVDLSASGTMDLNSAVSALNATYNGMAGTLGRQNGAIKNLTEEQLKNGEAVKIISEQYKGMAKKVADTTGSAQQLANTWGDFKEHIGSGIEKALTPVRKTITGLIQDVNNAIDDLKKAKENEGKSKSIAIGKGTDADYQSVYEYEKAKLDTMREEYETAEKILEIQNQIREKEAALDNTKRKDPARKQLQQDIKDLTAQAEGMSKMWQVVSKDYIARAKADYEAQLKIVEPLQQQVDKINKKAVAEANAKKAADAQAATEKGNADKAEAALKTYRETIAAKEQELKLRKELGEKITEEQENEEMLQTRIAAYIKLIQDAQGTITGDAERERIEREKIAELAERAANAKKEAEAEEAKKVLLKNLNDAIDGDKKQKQSQIMAKQISDLEIEYSKLTADKKIEIEYAYTEKIKELRKKQQEMEKQEKIADVQLTLSNIQEKLKIMQEFITQYSAAMASFSATITEAAEKESKARLAILDNEYDTGIMSEEEYKEKKNKIEAEAAQKTYRIQMWSWSAKIAEATANTAMAVINAIATSGNIYAGIALAAVASTMGAIQLATIISNKPVPPSNFATGGIVGGTSYTGDRVTAHVNSGEMILNRTQQKHLFDSINSNSLGLAPQMNVKIFNSASNEVSATPQITEDGMRIMIRKIVNDDMKNGRMNKSLIAAQSSFSGTRYTN